MDNFILCGMQYGDEGKGTFVDYLAHKYNINCVVKYNGGSQASHTVITPDGILHKFSQLGSGMFLEDCHTFLHTLWYFHLHAVSWSADLSCLIKGAVPHLLF